MKKIILPDFIAMALLTSASTLSAQELSRTHKSEMKAVKKEYDEAKKTADKEYKSHVKQAKTAEKKKVELEDRQRQLDYTYEQKKQRINFTVVL